MDPSTTGVPGVPYGVPPGGPAAPFLPGAPGVAAPPPPPLVGAPAGGASLVLGLGAPVSLHAASLAAAAGPPPGVPPPMGLAGQPAHLGHAAALLPNASKPVRDYIESTLAAPLMECLTATVRARPADPVGFLAARLIEYRDAQAARRAEGGGGGA
jgi:hypothetical protein